MFVVIGKQGQLAQELAARLNDRAICLGRNEIDLTSMRGIEEALAGCSVDAIINASAYTAVDRAESEADLAYLINQTAVGNLARYAKAHSVHLVHVSTDYVFSGQKGSPYLPTDELAPLGVYGASKAAGEKELHAVIPEGGCILRTSWVYSRFGNNFVKTMLRLMQERDALSVVDDQIGSPTEASGLARACIEAAERKLSGVYHYTDEGVASWYDFANAIQDIALEYRILHKRIPITPIPSAAFPTPAKRPNYSVLDKQSLRATFTGLCGRHWREPLRDLLITLADKP
ncbi:dTDP-4-dehydrorhamnose reductase [Bowmanella yangjiangensis]|uniref:dTDP-4-dehydrorhamnose reductase n=1 Tax=Bowmanella yangjiangensis TaxID=2811230 RepID=A0ABS3CTH8_9ALTE|nr:dTDP-4-dehydrorhamnose reductase [Bowmanella yangjiangensis]MBN7820428.1 dTDP-4-dehydrorhamnose reductase [Bowmanella yangjiangensis]